MISQTRLEIAGRAKECYSKEEMFRRYSAEYDKGGRKEKIIIVDVNCKGSSTGKIVYDLYTELRKDGRRAMICYGRGEKVNEEDVYKFGLDWETKIHAGLARITGYNGLFSVISTRRLIRKIEDFKPDVIHIHELHAYFVNIFMLLSYIKKKRIPVIWTFHCEYMYTGKCGHSNECRNFQTGCGNCPAVKDYPKSLLFDKTKQMFRRKKKLLCNLNFLIVTPSQWLADRVKMSFLKDKDISVIHNGVDTSIFHPTETDELKKQLRITDEYKVALAVAPDIMSECKGGKWVLELAKSMQEEKIIYLLIGRGKNPENLPSNVFFVGEVKNQKLLAQYYSLADFFLMLSKRETYSMTCAEALCCGTPVIGFKCGAPETVFGEPDALFVEYGDLSALESAVRRQIHNSEIG